MDVQDEDIEDKNAHTEDISDSIYLTATSSLSATTCSSSSHSMLIDVASAPPHAHAKQDSLLNIKAIVYLSLWYLFSAGTLFSNKYILSTLNSSPTLLGCSQILMTTVCGFVQLKLCTPLKRRSPANFRHFMFSMLQLGAMRFFTVVLGLVALKYVSVSFTETIKSSAPVFTVLITWLMLSETTPLLVFGSLLPIMVGLALTSAYDLSFHIIGFLSALTNNFTDCVQNVYSKKIISNADFDVQPAELQFYTSVASALLQVPISLLILDLAQTRKELNAWLLVYLLMNGIFFHLQSFTAFSLMAYISPVTHSVCNTVKRALLIWLSVLVFDNPITFLSGVGMVLVSLGVLLYNQARHFTENVDSR